VVKGLAALMVVAGMLAAAAPAGADRAPTRTERSAIAHAARILRPDCAAIRVSTVRHRYKWASVRIRDRCRDPRKRSVTRIFRRKRQRGVPWRLYSDFPCLGRVPERVADDLGITCFDRIRG
jgi:hypothetical protein